MYCIFKIIETDDSIIWRLARLLSFCCMVYGIGHYCEENSDWVIACREIGIYFRVYLIISNLPAHTNNGAIKMCPIGVGNISWH